MNVIGVKKAGFPKLRLPRGLQAATRAGGSFRSLEQHRLIVAEAKWRAGEE